MLCLLKKKIGYIFHGRLTLLKVKVFKYGVISGPYFFAFGLNTEIYSVFRPNKGKNGLEITPYLDTFIDVKREKVKESRKTG